MWSDAQIQLILIVQKRTGMEMYFIKVTIMKRKLMKKEAHYWRVKNWKIKKYQEIRRK